MFIYLAISSDLADPPSPDNDGIFYIFGRRPRPVISARILTLCFNWVFYTGTQIALMALRDTNENKQERSKGWVPVVAKNNPQKPDKCAPAITKNKYRWLGDE